MHVAVYAIAKDEERHVESWAASAQDADYLLLFDTGSTDTTVTVARDCGATVRRGWVTPWRFDDARNAALSCVPPWVDLCVALDLDEVLTPGWRGALEACAGATRPAYTYVWSWLDDGRPGLTYAGDKIHARHGYRWRHPVHEVLTPTGGLVEVRQPVDLAIHHHPDPGKSRAQYLPLLELAVAEDPDDDRNAHYLAREYAYRGMTEQAVAEFTRHLSLPRATWAPERAASMRWLGKLTGDVSWLIRACREAPWRREPWVDLARHHYEHGQWDGCRRAAQRALDITDRPQEYLNEADAWSWLPWDLLAVASWNLNRHDEARDAGRRALAEASDTERPRLAANLAWYEAKAA